VTKNRTSAIPVSAVIVGLFSWSQKWTQIILNVFSSRGHRFDEKFENLSKFFSPLSYSNQHRAQIKNWRPGKNPHQAHSGLFTQKPNCDHFLLENVNLPNAVRGEADRQNNQKYIHLHTVRYFVDSTYTYVQFFVFRRKRTTVRSCETVMTSEAKTRRQRKAKI
jgi:hypothetical protein